jgi:hypothetical protein
VNSGVVINFGMIVWINTFLIFDLNTYLPAELTVVTDHVSFKPQKIFSKILKDVAGAIFASQKPGERKAVKNWFNFGIQI